MNNLRIEDLRKGLELGDLGDRLTEYDNGYLCDVLTEIADNNVDIYNADLLEWAKDNYYYIEEAIDEYGFPKVNGQADFMRAIMQGQFYYNEKDLFENLYDIVENYILNYIENDLEITEISEEKLDEIKFEIEFDDTNLRLEDITEKVREILGVEA